MARNRTIYANEVLMVSPSATGYQFLNGDDSSAGLGGRHRACGESLLRQLKRLQSINYGYNINRTDTFQFGQLARISAVVLESPTVNLDFSYYLTDGKNEQLLGLDTNNDSNFLSPQLQSDPDGRNFFIYTTQEGKDAIGSISQIESQPSTAKSIVSLGNCYVTNYSANAAVGGIPTASVGVEGFNVRTEGGRGMTGRSPGIDVTNGVSADSQGRNFEISPEYISTGEGVSELMPGDINIDLGSASLLSLLTDSADKTAAHIQNFSIDIPMSRTTLQRVGNSFGFSKVLDLPITATVSVSAIMADRPSTAKSLFTELYENNKNDLTITLKKPSSLGSKKGDNAVVFKVKNATLDSESYGMSIGDNRTVDFSFSATIGEASVGGTHSYIDVNSSGVYEQWQVLETGVSTDDGGGRTDDPWPYVGFGNAVAANKDVLVIGASGWTQEDPSSIVEQGVAYIYKNDKGFFRQANQVSGNNGTLTVSNANRFPEAASSDEDWNLGAAVAVSSGSTVAVSAPNNPEAEGGIGFYEPNTDKTSWTLTSIIGATDMGWDYGQAIAFDKSASGDYQLFFLGGPSAGGGGGATGKCGEVRVAIGTNGAGTADNYTSSTTELSYDPPGGGDTTHGTYQFLGYSVAAHNGIVVAGAPGSRVLSTAGGADSNPGPSGAAFVWSKPGAVDGAGTPTAASQVALYKNTAILTGTVWDSAGGGGTHAESPAFGADVDIYGDTIVVGAPSGKGGAAGTVSRAGRAFVFTARETTDSTWDYAAALTANDGEADANFGDSVQMPNQNTIIVGAPGALGNLKGAVYVFTGYGSNWDQTQKLYYTGTAAGNQFSAARALAATQKEIFVGSSDYTDKWQSHSNNPEKVIRYRI